MVKLMKQIAVTIEHEDFMFLKQQGISRSEFFRQALGAYKDGKFVYDKSKQR